MLQVASKRSRFHAGSHACLFGILRGTHPLIEIVLSWTSSDHNYYLQVAGSLWDNTGRAPVDYASELISFDSFLDSLSAGDGYAGELVDPPRSEWDPNTRSIPFVTSANAVWVHLDADGAVDATDVLDVEVRVAARAPLTQQTWCELLSRVSFQFVGEPF